MAHLHALVVDDSTAMRKQLCYALQRVVGMDTVEASDGADAWRKLLSVIRNGSAGMVLAKVQLVMSLFCE